MRNIVTALCLIIDGTVFERETPGGIARLFSNTLPLLCDLDPKLKIQLFFTKTPRIPYPKHKQISVFLPETVQKILRPFKFNTPQKLKFQRKFLQIWLRNSRDKFWLSTYFTTPPENWQGKQVVMVHDFIYELFPAYIPGGESVVRQKALAISGADKVICNSQTTANDLRLLFPVAGKDIFVAHLAADPVFRLKPPDQISDRMECPFVLFVGKRGNYKNFATLLEAYSQWQERHAVKLVAVGSDFSEAECKAIKEMSLEEDVVIIEHPNDEVLCDLYNQALAFVYPSLYEGFGIPLLEAMQCGCPIIASRIPSTEEVAGDIPFYFDAEDPLSLVAALDRLSNNEELQSRIREGLLRAKQFSWRATAEVFHKALKSAINE